MKFALRLQGRWGRRNRGRNGRPAIYPDEFYIALLILRSYFNWTYRETEAFFCDLFPGKPCPSFQALHWYIKHWYINKKLGEEKLLRLLELVKEHLRPFLQSDGILILDSTGIPHRGKTQKLGWMRGRFPRVVRGHARLCLAIWYLRDKELLLPVGMCVGGGYAPDPILGAKALRGADPGGVLLADAGFDSGWVYKWVYKEVEGRFIPMIRLKGGGEIKDASWKEACKAFCVEIHRLRAEDKAEQEAKELMSRSRNRAKCEREHHPIRLPLC